MGLLNGIGIGFPFFHGGVAREVTDYIARVTADSGTVDDVTKLSELVEMYKRQNLLDSTKLLVAPFLGYKERISAPYSYLSKLYSLRLAANDAAQTTEVNQLYKAGYIAPNEVLSAKNPNRDARFMTHPAISFAANQAWSIVFVFNDNSSSNTLEIINKGNIVLYTKISSARICLYSDVNNKSVRAAENGLSAKIGKTNIIHCVADGVNVPKIFYNGVEASLEPGYNTELIYGNFTQLYAGQTTNSFFGTSHYYRIQSGAMTPSQITAEYDLLRSWIPEIESVQIGSQVWASSNLDVVATPLGNVIKEMQLNALTNMLAADGTFNDLSKWNLLNCTINSGVVTANVPTNTTILSTLSDSYLTNVPAGTWIKGTLNVLTVNSGFMFLFIGSSGNAIGIATPGQKTFYVKVNYATQYGFRFSTTNSAFDGTFTNLTIEQLGWANSTEIYDAVYAATSGTAAEKHYAAVKEAAMWCSYDNSTANQAIYGKILNGYAIKLLRLDMITANYGYKPPLQADWDALETYLGVDAGNDVKHDGTTYWSAPNGGTNSSGLTILPGGYRNELGAFIGLNDEVYMITADESDDRVGGYARLIKD